ncbi:MAG: hypothetical protein ACXVZM_00480 [Terriglobales bacterium]
MKRGIGWVLGVTMWAALGQAAHAQSSEPAPNSDSASPAQDDTTPRKAHRVWTNEDVENIKGGINVVGESNEKPNKKTPDSADQPGDSESPASAAETCQSDEWSAAVEATAQAQGVALDRKFWRTKLFGDLCSSGIQMEAVGRRISGDYTLDDGTRLRLSAIMLSHGFPKSEDMVADTDAGRPYIVSWKKRPLVLTRVDYIVRTHSNGMNTYTISKMYMRNALTGRELLFDVTTDRIADIEGTLQLSVSKRQ